MSRQMDPDRLLEKWLVEGPSRMPDRVVDRIVTQLDQTKQRKPMWLLGRGTVNNRYFAIGGLAAVLVLAVLGVGYVFGPLGGLGGKPTPPPSPSPSPSPTALPTIGSNVAPGRYFVDVAGYRYTFTVGDAGWDRAGDANVVLVRHDPTDPEHGILYVWGQVPGAGLGADLYRDPCNWRGTGFTPGPTVDDYATALTTIAYWNPTQPTDVTVGGRHGKRLQLTVPTDANFAACDDGEIHLSDSRWFQAPGQTEDMRILDFDGGRYLIATTWFPTTPAEVRTQLDQMVDSMEIHRP